MSRGDGRVRSGGEAARERREGGGAMGNGKWEMGRGRGERNTCELTLIKKSPTQIWSSPFLHQCLVIPDTAWIDCSFASATHSR